MAYLSDFSVWLNNTTRQSIFGMREKITLRSLLNNMSEQTLTDLYNRFASRIWYYDHIDVNPFCTVSSILVSFEQAIDKNDAKWQQTPESETIADPDNPGKTIIIQHYDEPCLCIEGCPFGASKGYCGMEDSLMYPIEQGIFLKVKFADEFEKFEEEKERFPELD